MIQTPLKVWSHAEMPAYAVPEYPDTEDEDFMIYRTDFGGGAHTEAFIGPISVAVGDFTSHAWRNFLARKSDTPRLPVLWNKDNWNYHVLIARNGETIPTTSGQDWNVDTSKVGFVEPQVPWAKAHTLLRLPNVILTNIHATFEALEELGAGAVQKNIAVGIPPEWMCSFLTCGLPCHG